MVTFEIDLSIHDQYCIQGEGLPTSVLRRVKRVVTNQWMDDPDYNISKACGAFLQGYNEGSGWILVEFWIYDTRAIETFIDYVNREIKEL